MTTARDKAFEEWSDNVALLKLDPHEAFDAGWEAALALRDKQLREIISALKLVIEENKPHYHDCTDDGLPECAWCIADKALVLVSKGEEG